MNLAATVYIRTLVAGLFLAWVTAGQARELVALSEPEPAPELRLALLDGSEIDLRRHRGEVIMLNFWATWCPPCRKEMPSMRRLAERLDGQAFRILAVNVGESREEIEGFLETVPLPFQIVQDPNMEATQAWGVPGLPYSFLIDAEGLIRYRLAGEYEWDSAAAVETVSRLLPGH
jgi:thiol-disulfide isomerase/thioredoxin